MYYAYRFITVLNDIETLFNNNVLAALMLFWVESCSMLSTGVIEGFIWGEFTLSKAGLYLWQGLRDYRYATVIIILLEHFFVDSARIKFSIPLFPPGDILRRKFIQGWDCLDYHDHYFAFVVMFLIFGYVSVFKQSGFVAKLEHEDHDKHEKHDKHDKHNKHEAHHAHDPHHPHDLKEKDETLIQKKPVE